MPSPLFLQRVPDPAKVVSGGGCTWRPRLSPWCTRALSIRSTGEFSERYQLGPECWLGLAARAGSHRAVCFVLAVCGPSHLGVLLSASLCFVRGQNSDAALRTLGSSLLSCKRLNVGRAGMPGHAVVFGDITTDSVVLERMVFISVCCQGGGLVAPSGAQH